MPTLEAKVRLGHPDRGDRPDRRDRSLAQPRLENPVRKEARVQLARLDLLANPETEEHRVLLARKVHPVPTPSIALAREEPGLERLGKKQRILGFPEQPAFDDVFRFPLIIYSQSIVVLFVCHKS
jgi:hypothetical protein